MLAYALVLEPGPVRARVLSIAPQLAVGVAWAAVYLLERNGARGMSFYRELSAPHHVLVEGLLDLPLTVTVTGNNRTINLAGNNGRLQVLGATTEDGSIALRAGSDSFA